MSLQNDPSDAGQFLGFLRDSLDQNTFIKLVLAKYRGAEPELVRVTIRPVNIKDQKLLSFVSHYRERDTTENFPVEKGVASVKEFLGTTFKAAHLLLLNEDIHLEFNKKGKSRLTHSKPTNREVDSGEHDRKKNRIIDHRRPFLQELGIASSSGQIYPSMSHKWKQINKFIEFAEHAIAASGLSVKDSVEVVDFGCGKGYLTFAIHDFLKNTLNKAANVIGVELRDNLVRFCNNAAEKLNCDGLSFRQGDIGSYTPVKADILIALHACDTATDLAIHMGISAGSTIIMCAPCCHKEIRPQMKAPELLKPILRFGSHLAQEADMVTDALRALLLETQGYDVSIFEFISLEHTDKNKMIMAVKRQSKVTSPERVWEQINAIKGFYGIREHKLEALLNTKTALTLRQTQG